MGQSITPDGLNRLEQRSLLSAMWRYRWMTALVVTASIMLGIWANQVKTVDYVATAGLIVDDPRASSVEVTDVVRQSTQDSERNLADQVEILRSTEAAVIASELTGGRFTSKEILEASSVTGDITSNLIDISYRALSPEGAKVGADALLNAYVELRRDQVQATAETALASLDALTSATDIEIAAIETRIQELTEPDEDRLALEAQIEEATRELGTLRVERESFPVESPERQAINAQIDELLRDFQAWQAVLDLEVESRDLTVLEADRNAAVAERATLVARRNAIAVDAQLATGGVTLASPALLPEDAAGLGDVPVMAASVVLGLAAAAVVGYALSLGGQGLATRDFPEGILGAPLLAEVPDFAHEGIATPLPVTAAPASAAAESFRFAAAALDIRGSSTDSRMISIVSATVGAGKTATAANAGLAAAREGKRILLVDGDFGNQELTRLLFEETPKRGITDVVNGDVHLLKALVDVSQSDGRSVSLLSRGSQDVDAASFYQSILTREFFAHLAVLYDLVIVDCPPLLQVAYASTLVAYTEASVVVVEHNSPTKRLVDLADRMKLIGTPVLGYVYTKAPLRRELTTGVGSMSSVSQAPKSQLNRTWRSRFTRTRG